MAGSVGIIMAIGVSAVLGFFLLLGLLFSIQDLDATINSATGQPVAQIFLDTVGEKGAIVLMVRNLYCHVLVVSLITSKTIVIGAMFFCGYVLALNCHTKTGSHDLVQDIFYHLK